jgi:hypothetical protein
MARWDEIEQAAPDLAEGVRRVFDAHKHKTMATLRKDGGPRISGTELDFAGGNVCFGSMWGAMKARDLQRDPRLALHSATVDPEMALGDAKIAGRAIEITDEREKADFMRAHAPEGGPDRAEEPPEPYHLFRVDVTEIVLTKIGDPPDHLVVESWHEGTGTKRVERR